MRPAHLVAGLDAPGDPARPAGGGGGVALLDPLLGEARVEDAARPRLQPRVGDHRLGHDTGQVRRVRRRRVELRDARVRDADHADLPAQHPVLRGDDLDGVVAVGGLGRVEHVEHPARAAGASHVHRHGGVAERPGDADPGLLGRRVGRAVARVLDDRRPGPGTVEGFVGEAHVGAELHPVAHLEVLEPLVDGRPGLGVAEDVEAGTGQRLAVVERRVGHVVAAGHRHHLGGEARRRAVVDDGVAPRLDGRAVHGVEGTEVEAGTGLHRGVLGRQVGEVRLSLVVGEQREQLLPARAVQRERLAGGGAGDRDLLDADANVPGRVLGVAQEPAEPVVAATAARAGAPARGRGRRQHQHEHHRRRPSPTRSPSHRFPRGRSRRGAAVSPVTPVRNLTL